MPSRHPHPVTFLVAAAFALFAQGALAGGWAIGGMDVVELRDNGRLVAGQPGIATHWHGQDWLFTAEPQRNTFESDPRRYAPAFGGACPVQLAKGHIAPGRPEFAMIVGGRLYLLSSEAGRAAMAADPKHILDEAAQAWRNRGE